jgi:hypothetical protein
MLAAACSLRMEAHHTPWPAWRIPAYGAFLPTAHAFTHSWLARAPS